MWGKGVLNMSERKNEKIFAILMILPALLIYGSFYLFPGLQAFKVATYDWTGFNEANIKHVGIRNFLEVINDGIFWNAFFNTLAIILIGGVVIISMALMFANLFTKYSFPGLSLFKTLIFFPYSVSVVAIGIIWTFIFNPNFGLFNVFLGKIGLYSLAKVAWLGERSTALACIIFVSIWWEIGLFMVLFIAGMQRIPVEYYDAAKIDGARQNQVFMKITLPMLKEVLIIGIMYWVINAWQSFGVVYVMTKGGPSNLTHTIATYMVWISLNSNSNAYRMGYGTAIAVVLFILVVTMSIMYKLLTRKEAIQY